MSIEKLVNMECCISNEVTLLEEDLTDKLHNSSINIENIISDRRMVKRKHLLLIVIIVEH
jgi:hypothetical protein